MQENHQLEQYFFAPSTITMLADLLTGFEAPCCLGTPTVAAELSRRGQQPRLLELDPRLSGAPGFRRWDMHRPTPTGERYDAVIVDPPFQRVRLSQLFTALRVLTDGQPRMPLFLCHLARRAHDIQGTLGAFGLSPTGMVLEYVSVHPTHEERIILYSNVPLDLSS